MTVYRVVDKTSIASLFAGWQETFIWSCLQDCMGEAYADNLDNPVAAAIIVGDFCLLAGSVNDGLIRYVFGNHPSEFMIIASQNKQWEEAIEHEFQEKACRHTRYATKKDQSVFNLSELQAIILQLPDRYELKMIDQDLFEQSRALPWAKDLCGNYSRYEAYQKNGLGVGILENGSLVSGASSYFFYQGGIEIEVDTRVDKRRQGLALIAAAQLILACLERNLYPSWDAHNKASLALAEKLGYVFDREYSVFLIS